jgi:hypothetical protein
MTEQTSEKSAADQSLAAELERHGRELLAMAATLRGSASGEAAEAEPAPPEMLSVANVASLLGISKDAARMAISRRGAGVKVGGRVQVPRSVLPTLHRDRSIVRGAVRFVRSRLDPDASMIPDMLEAK